MAWNLPRTKTREYLSWSSMRTRCRNPRSTQYPSYGGRGIRVCERWNSYDAFRQDMGRRPDGATLDRIDPNGDYEPANCRWATAREQQKTKRHSGLLTVGDQTLLPVEWAERTGLTPSAIHSRIYDGWDAERAISTPLRQRRIVVVEMLTMLATGISQRAIARHFGVHPSAVTQMLKRRKKAAA